MMSGFWERVVESAVGAVNQTIENSVQKYYLIIFQYGNLLCFLFYNRSYFFLTFQIVHKLPLAIFVDT